jgi:hypothetical protein
MSIGAGHRDRGRICEHAGRRRYRGNRYVRLLSDAESADITVNGVGDSVDAARPLSTVTVPPIRIDAGSA